MTLSGDGDPGARRRKAAQQRQEINAKATWVTPLLVSIAVVIIVAVIGYAIITGTAF